MKDKFDDILKRRWEEQHFPVDEKHRAEMISLLDGKKNRRIFPFWWIGGLGLAAIVAGYIMMAPQHAERPAPDSQHDEYKELKPQGDVQIAREKNFTNTSGTNTVANEGLNTATSDVPGKHADSVKSTPSNTSKSNPGGNNTGILEKKSKTKTPVMAQSQLPGSQQDLNSLIDSGADENLKNTHFNVDEDATRSYQIVSRPFAVTVEPETDEEANALTTPATRAVLEIDFLDFDGFSGIVYSGSHVPGPVSPKTSYRKNFYLFAEAGVGFIFASKPDYAAGWKLRAGGGLGYAISPKVQLTWSAGYLGQEGGFNFERSSAVNQPGFGTRSSFNRLTPDRLHFVYTHIGAQYRFVRNLISVHGGIQYLYGAQGDIVTQTMDQFVPGVKETSAYAWVKTDGLRRLNWTADVSYGFQFTPRLAVLAGTDIYFSSFTVSDAALSSDGFYWKGTYAALHPFVTLNYLFYGR